MLAQLHTSLAEKQSRLESVTTSHNTIKDKHTDMENALASSEGLLQTLLTGLSSNKDGNTGGGYLGQIADAKARASQGRAEEEQANVKLKMSEKDLKTLQDRWKTVEREAKDGARDLDALRKTVEGMKQQMAATGWSEEKEQAYETGLREVKTAVRQLSEVGQLTASSLS